MKWRYSLVSGLILVDCTLLNLVFLFACWFRTHLHPAGFPASAPEIYGLYFRLSLLSACFGCFSLYTSGAYNLNRFSGLDHCFSLLRALTLSSLSLLVVMYILAGNLSPGNLFLDFQPIIGFAWLLSILTLLTWHWAFRHIRNRVWARGKGLQRVLLLGGGDTAHRLYRTMARQPVLGYLPIGILTSAEPHTREDGVRILGDLHSLPGVLKTEPVDEVILGTSQIKGELVALFMTICQRADVRFSAVPSLFEILTSRTRAREVAGIPIFTVEEPLQGSWNRRVKRTIDLALGSAAILLTLPLWVCIAIAIKLESPGPVLFRQKRMGKGEKYFDVFKFRSMYENAEARQKELEPFNEADGPIFKMRNDPRRTRVGQWIRRWSLDELPQLINVVKGDMSLVGPRPYPIGESEQFDAFQRRRYDVLPGITGLAQVNGRSDLSIEETLRLDLYYIENWSFANDLKILLKTIPSVLTRKGAY